MIRSSLDRKSQLLRWAGSKRQSTESLSSHLDFTGKYIEPFCGSAAFFFSHSPRKAALNDTNKSLINFYQFLKRDPEGLWNIYRCIRTDSDTYYRVRERYNALELGVRKGAYFLYLNHFCFNGLYRTNRRGEFNTPLGAHHKSKKKLSLAALLEYSKIAHAATFHARDFEDFLQRLAPVGSCIYMDPPYATRDDRVFGEYGHLPFSLKDLKRLKKVAVSYSKENRVVISYKDCTEFRELFSTYIVDSVSITRNVGGFSGRRKRDEELVAVLDGR